MKKIFSMLLACVTFTSCVDTVILPDNKTVDEDFWKKKSEVEAVVNAAYAQLRDETAMENLVIWGDLRSDELKYSSMLPKTNKYYTPLTQMHSMMIDTKNPFTEWRPFYVAINYCNLVLDKAAAVVEVDPEYDYSDYLVNVSQVKALRAFCYFTLLKVFHDIPVTPGVLMNASDDTNIAQSTPAQVLDMCISDLLEVVGNAPSNNAFTQSKDLWKNRGLMNRDAINSLLAEIYLWRGSINRDLADYQACVDRCNMVIADKKAAGPGDTSTETGVKEYYLFNQKRYFNEIFGLENQNSTESIFEIQFKGITESQSNPGLERMYFSYDNKFSNGFGLLKATPIFGSVEGSVWTSTNDYRLYDFVEGATTSLDEFAVRKYNALSGAEKSAQPRVNVTSNHNWIVYRLTDIMLMKAEALVQIAEATADETEKDALLQKAYDLVVVVCDRAHDDENKSTGGGERDLLSFAKVKTTMESVVLRERARELCFEGKRYYDLMRYNYRHCKTKADLNQHLWNNSVPTSDEFLELALKKYTGGVMRAKFETESQLYMPISQDEMEKNTALIQNPSYKETSKK